MFLLKNSVLVTCNIVSFKKTVPYIFKNKQRNTEDSLTRENRHAGMSYGSSRMVSSMFRVSPLLLLFLLQQFLLLPPILLLFFFSSNAFCWEEGGGI